MKEACAATLATSPGYEDEVELALDRLPVYVSLNQIREPVLRYALRLQFRVHVTIPAEILLYNILGCKAMLLIKAPLTLQIAC